MAIKIRRFDREGRIQEPIALDFLPFGHAGGGKAAGDVTSVPSGWKQITFTSYFFDQEVDENPTLWDAGGINIVIFFYLMRASLGISPNILTNQFYYQDETVTGLASGTTRDLTGWLGGSIVGSQTSEYDHDILYKRVTKFAWVEGGKWRVVMLNPALVGTASAAKIVNNPRGVYIADSGFGAGVFGTTPTHLPGNTEGVRVWSLTVQTSGMAIGLAKGTQKGLGLYTFRGKLIRVLDPGRV